MIGSIGEDRGQALRFVSLRPDIRPTIVFIKYVDELSQIEYLAAPLALDKLGVFLAGDDANLRVLAHYWHRESFGLVKILPTPNALVNREFRHAKVFFKHQKVQVIPKGPA